MRANLKHMAVKFLLAKKRNLAALAVIALIVACAALSALWPEAFSAKQTLADGTVISLSVLDIGPAACYEGTLLERTLGRLAPAKALKIGR